jgi:hypothetical protein
VYRGSIVDILEIHTASIFKVKEINPLKIYFSASLYTGYCSTDQKAVLTDLYSRYQQRPIGHNFTLKMETVKISEMSAI